MKYRNLKKNKKPKNTKVCAFAKTVTISQKTPNWRPIVWTTNGKETKPVPIIQFIKLYEPCRTGVSSMMNFRHFCIFSVIGRGRNHNRFFIVLKFKMESGQLDFVSVYRIKCQDLKVIPRSVVIDAFNAEMYYHYCLLRISNIIFAPKSI